MVPSYPERENALTHLMLLAVLLCPSPLRAAEDAALAGPPFEEVAAASGLDFEHFTGATGELYFPEIVGSGVGLLDYDNDGDLDLYVVQGAPWGTEQSDPPADWKGKWPPSDRLFRNELEEGDDGETRLRFVDVTEESGLRGATGYGMGVATGDFDRDGRVDLYVTNFGSNQLWHNEGPGADGIVTFSDATDEAGVDDVRWSVPAAFLDFDRDGWLDLFVGNYTDYRLATHKQCFSPSGYRDYCAPASYGSEPDRLFRNLGPDAAGAVRFEEVTLKSGLGSASGYALGAIPADFDGDGWMDLYVANDGVPNFLWRNRGDGTFQDEALLMGCAVNALGEPEASMGVDAADVDGDGDVDLFMTHLGKETNTLFLNDGQGGFVEVTDKSGLGKPSWRYTGFGTAWLDFDNDGELDLLVVNGAVSTQRELVEAGDPYPFHQPNQLFHNVGGGRFEEVSSLAGEPFALSEVSRGAAFGDLDNDGDTDVVVSNNRGPLRLLRNRVGQDRSWVGLRLRDAEGLVDLVGTHVQIVYGERRRWKSVRVAGSYASAADPRLLFGLGDYDGAEVSAEVVWLDGRRERFERLAPAAYHELRQGSGRPLSAGERE